MMKHFNLLRNSFNSGWKILDVKFYSDTKIDFKNILFLNKRTRYELEKVLRPGINDAKLEEILRKRGSDFDRLLLHHNRHVQYKNKIIDSFRSHGLEVKTVNRTTYGDKEVEWADLVVVGGGDGTFLLGASQIHNRNKPIVGFNTDPNRSVGHLCLPKKYTFVAESAVKKIINNEFRWVLRNRIEVELEGPHASENVVILDPTKVKSIPDCIGAPPQDYDKITKRVLPSFALNEVFMSETVSSHVSHMVVHPDDWPPTNVKCSGLCVATGTGSTSWHMSINRLTKEKVEKLLLLMGQSVNDLEKITEVYNSSIRFSAEDSRLYWSLREPIYGTVFPDPPGLPSGGFTSKLSVISRCYSGFLVIDGTHCYPFPDGTKARLYSSPDKCLRTIRLD